MASRICQPWRGQDSARAQAQAESIIAQGRQAARELSERSRQSTRTVRTAEEEPINRYIYPLPRTFPSCESCAGASQVYMERMLEVLTQQNQLLIDLLGAVNSLTAATLSVQGRFS